MAAAALVMASCSSDEIDRVVPQTAGGLLPLEMVPDVANQTRAAQITADNLTAFTVDVTGTFKTADGTDVVNPVLALTKSGDTWSYTYKVGDAAPVDAQLYWPVEPETTTFSAHTAVDGASINEKTAQTDIVGDYRTVDFDGTSATSTVALTMRHAVSKMEFKARVQAPATAGTDISIDIKQVAVRNVKYTGTYAKPAVAENGGVLTATGEAGNLFTETRTESSFITSAADAATTLGSLFMVPQTEIAASAFSTPATPGAYLSVLAQIRVTQGELTTVTFPEAGTIDAAGTKYAWIAVPMPEEFTQMQAHHKYIFTLNFSTDALGHTDIVQDEPSDITPAPEEFETVEVKGRSGNAVSVSVETVNDFDEDTELKVNPPYFKMAAAATVADQGRLICTDGHIHTYGKDTGCPATRVAKIFYVGSETGDETYTHGLALQLSNTSVSDWYGALEVCPKRNTTIPVTDALWILASKDQWEKIIGTSGGDFAAFRDGFKSVGGANMTWGVYWSSTAANASNAWRIGYTMGQGWSSAPKTNKHYVRACLVF
jgi:hypothetical protein